MENNYCYQKTPNLGHFALKQQGFSLTGVSGSSSQTGVRNTKLVLPGYFRQMARFYCQCPSLQSLPYTNRNRQGKPARLLDTALFLTVKASEYVPTELTALALADESIQNFCFLTVAKKNGSSDELISVLQSLNHEIEVRKTSFPCRCNRKVFHCLRGATNSTHAQKNIKL